jgi:hypothetical protein
MSDAMRLAMANISIQKQMSLTGEQTGVDIRNPSTALLCISSIDRYEFATDVVTKQSSPYDFQIAGIQTSNLMNGFFTRLAVNEVQFRWTLPTLTSRNNKMYINISGTDYLLTLPEGWYDIYNDSTTAPANQGNIAYQLQLAVTSLAGNPFPNFTCVYSTNSTGTTHGRPYNCFKTQQSSGSTSYYFKRYTDPSRPNAVGLFEMMAFKPTTTGATTQYGSPNASMLSTPFVDIICDQLTYNQSLKDVDTGIARNVLCRLFLTPDGFTGNLANFGSAPILTHRCFPFPKQVKWNANQPISGGLRFQVYDSQGYLLSTYDSVSPNGGTFPDAECGDWTITLLVSEV